MLKSLRIGSRKGSPHVAGTPEEFRESIEQGFLLEQGLLAMDHLMDGQLDKAQAILSKSNSPFEKIAQGVLHFIEATAGMESEAVHAAVHHLSVSEHVSQKAKDALVHSGLQTSSFRPGAEYELVHVESGLLSAVSMLLTESLIDAAKALYKLRKTYLALEDLRKHVEATKLSDTSKLYSNGAGASADLQKFRDAHNERMKFHGKPVNPDILPQVSLDEYIISGVQACSGLLNIIISSVPPNLTKLLSIVGFHGDRALGLKMLWSTVDNYNNIHSCLALIALLMFFDGPTHFSDITLNKEDEEEISKKFASDTDLDKKTTTSMTPAELAKTSERLRDALVKSRKHYPHGVLWLLFWGRKVAQTDLAKGVEILESKECGPNQMKPVEGLLVFDRTMMLLSLHRYEEASEAFIHLLDISTWSHALYVYMAGAIQVELYRMNKIKNPTKAAEHKKLANKYLEQAPTMIGKKKFMARSMPFDKVVIHKCQEIKKIAEHNNLELADAVGTSLLHEASYFWYVHARTPKELIPESLELLSYSGREDAPLKETEEQKFTRELLTSIYLRVNGQVKEGLELLETLLPKAITPWSSSNGGPPEKVMQHHHRHNEPWAGPQAVYERGIFEWVVNGKKGAAATRKWLKIVGDWDVDYDLSTRLNMRLSSATDKLDIYRL